ncbi:Probable type I restriction enzyme BthVORF4518P M protein [Mycoplasmopsis californica]|uniref:site-specific DNA-methyltransferase (adenine-specific) n=1 Tax=Mycoplasmopsis equigenitalium TaxID=114883 RepID=A0ABY5J1Y0_9BACT|nr:type I restriction-modification system subunit M [Mycoplasmopsis equigenitalium]UUD37259.1 type I restriction-modification system subunit M [Mycoplasmopsis equigenitalium]VEU69433.1 Probable type I restriction enzyme BthVORF4518P M protein [Mycoplasmopsis californica]
MSQNKDELLAKQQSDVDAKLWAMANELRGSMEASEFKNYILGLIFYKFLSNKIIKTLNDELKDENLSFDQAWKDESMRNDIKELSVRIIGYFLDPVYLFDSFVNKINVNQFSVEDLKEGIKAITSSTIGTESQEDFADLFDDMDLDNNKLGKGEAERSKLIGKIILKINDLNLDISETNFDILGHAYEYLIGKFAASAGKKAGEFYTPAQVSELLARIVTLENKNLKSAYDPTCGSGSLLLRVRNNVQDQNAIKLYGQEMVTTTYNLARMNMLLHGVDYEKFDIANDDTLEKPSERHKALKFDAVVANPPYSAKWDPEGKDKDSRFNSYDGKYAPSSKADYAFVEHMIYHLSNAGTLAVVLPHGVLFRRSSEEIIRTKIIKDYNYLDAVIGLPANLFFGTSIPTCILVMKKTRTNPDDVVFIDASKYFENGKNQNYLREEDVVRILDAYKARKDIDKYMHVASLDEIKENEYNLNIPRYVDTFEEEEPIDIHQVMAEIKELEAKRDELDKEIEKYLEELGLCVRA